MTDLCRLCLEPLNLSPIFLNASQYEFYSSVLLMTTGLEIRLNDGLPQTICLICREAVESSHRLRIQSANSEKYLLSCGYQYQTYTYLQADKIYPSSGKNENKKSSKDQSYDEKRDFEIEVQLDRISDDAFILGDNTDLVLDFAETPKSVDYNDQFDKKVNLDLRNEQLDSIFNKPSTSKDLISTRSIENVETDRLVKEKEITIEYKKESKKEKTIENKEVGASTEIVNKDDLINEKIIKHKEEITIKKQDTVNMSRKEKRALYLSMIDGPYKPKETIKCKLCGNVLKNWNTFLGHIQMHLGFRFVCEFCGKPFKTTHILLRHCRSVHGLEKELQCPQCDYKANDNSQLLVHKRRVHTGERPYICDLCSASYFNRKCLIQHIDSHRTENNVQCPKCSKKLKSNRHLSRHIYVMHKSKEYNYKCSICNQIYTNFKYARTHLSKVHGTTTKQAKIIKIKL